ncbi:MAG: adenylate/guanylate cyclase domain-containing protein [Candidatus Desulfatibia sp.]|uniref:adenylate/guanylate cyclase domain-containing protein n=1 Tax=Candidatus Desulfatibia sp. TaxID=3101189 RepID=UPI002F34C6F9
MNKLVLIDDEEGVRRSVARALKRESYQTYTAANGEAGITFIKKNRDQIATVISDYKMPGLNGLETLAAIGSINPEITRIILTGYATMEAAIQATNEGIDGFLTKPFDNVELRANIHKISVRKRLKQFVPEQIYKKIEKSPIALDPTFHEVSILFSDIRGFTHMSQKVPPAKLAAFLNNDYFTPMGEIAYTHNGMVDKHIGDSIMVVFGSPVERRDDTIRAVKAAVAMQQKAKEIDRVLATQNGLRLKIGIGIATGSAFSGIIGSLRIKEFTSIGMPVNIAARLQGMARAEEILICDTTFQKLAGKIDAKPLPPVAVKGLDGPITVYKVKY